MWKGGMSEIDITPPLGLAIPGYLKVRKAEGIKDPLFLKALVLDDGERRLAMISVDAIGVESPEIGRIRLLVNERTGIQEANLMVSATHIHTGGPVYLERDFRDEAYLDLLVHKAADAVSMALANLQPVRLSYGMGLEDSVSFNRRYKLKDGSVRTNPGVLNPEIVASAGPIDPKVSVLRIDAEDGSALGVLTNFALHCDTVSGKSYSADFPGVISRHLKSLFGKQIVSMFMAGAGGDINHINVKRKQQLTSEDIGVILACEVLKARQKATEMVGDKLQVSRQSMVVEARLPSKQEVVRARELVQSSEADPELQAPPVFFAKQTLLLEERQESKAEIEVQVFRIGELSIVGVPCELFVEIGLDLQRQSAAQHTLIHTYTNGVYGYVPTFDAYEQGGYETKLTSRTRLTPEAGKQMKEAALQMIENMH